jgi:hypothetical protein
MRLNLTALIVLATMVVTGCSKNTVNLVYFTSQQKIALHPKNGDVLVWTDFNGNAVTTVTFPLGSPCKSDSDLANGRCTIAVPNESALYKIPYACAKCVDPEIVVGSESGVVTTQSAPVPPTAEVQAACLKNQVTIYPVTVTLSQTTVGNGAASVRWTPGGITPVGSDWTTNDLSSICSNGPRFNKDNDTCTLYDSAVTTNFTLSSASCNNTSATGTIAIE